ncbi:SIS domain-containing protein [Micromonospora sp. CPCC 206060]|uniref:SIS domain-containing protein n=1 Tax=Micromonospora sp. CPCC 206060 TaxID=3122406 RepID=UPI002FF3D5EF
MSLEPDVVLRQVRALPADLRTLLPAIEAQVREVLPSGEPAVRNVYLTGVGDSYHAGRAAELAFVRLAGVRCRPVGAQRFALYSEPEQMTAADLVIGVSASGGTERVVEALARARSAGCRTLAVTGRPDSAVDRVAHAGITAQLPDDERSPGIRTYQASLLGLLSTALRLAELGGAGEQETARARDELWAATDVLAATNEALSTDAAAGVGELSAGVTAVVGSGPSHGTAQFAAAKLVETAGVPAFAQDLEEWWHVERFIRPVDNPLVVVAPPGRSRQRAEALAARAAGIGRRVITVQDRDDVSLARHSRVVLAVQGQVREEFSPVVYHCFASFLAAGLAQRLDRRPFLTDLPGGSPAVAPAPVPAVGALSEEVNR